MADVEVLSRFPKTGRGVGLVLRPDGGLQLVAHGLRELMRALKDTVQASLWRRPELDRLLEQTNRHLMMECYTAHNMESPHYREVKA